MEFPDDRKTMYQYMVQGKISLITIDEDKFMTEERFFNFNNLNQKSFLEYSQILDQKLITYPQNKLIEILNR